MKPNLEPEHGEIISKEDYEKVYEKIRTSHQIGMMPIEIMKRDIEWFKEKNLYDIFIENKSILENGGIYHIKPVKDIPEKYKTDVGEATFFVKQ